MRFPVQTKNKNVKGFALLEILLAFGISIIIVTAMVSLAVSTVRAATTNNAYSEAGKLAQRQAERLKLKRDTTGWSDFLLLLQNCSGTPCYIDSGLTIQSGNKVEGTGPTAVTYSFRTGSVVAGTKEFTYTVTTSWNISNKAKTYIIEGLLSDWQAI